MSLKVIDIEVADNILHHSCKDGRKKLRTAVNIRGQAICVSEIIKIKQSSMFLIKLSADVNIVWKSNNLSQCHDKISPYQEFIFASVQPTTLMQGHVKGYRVYAATDQSKIYQPDEITMVTISFNDWSSQHGCGNKEYKEQVNSTTKVCEDLFSYQGIITDIIDGSMGVYELDKTARLYVGKIPAKNKFTHLQNGVTILVNNAHHRISDQSPKLQIYCCMLTSIQVIGEDRTLRCEKKTSDVMKELLYLSKHTQYQLDYIHNMRQILLTQFSNRCMEEIFPTIVNDNEIFDPGLYNTNRNLITEFLSSPHLCMLQDTGMLHHGRCLVTVNNVISNISDITSTGSHWNYLPQYADKKNVIVGVLHLNDNGNIVLKDSTNNVGVLVSMCHGNSNEYNHHQCSTSCDCSMVLPGNRFPCPYIHSCCVGKIVCVLAWQYVCESFCKDGRGLGIKNSMDRSKNPCDKYIIFSMKDTLFLNYFDEVAMATVQKVDGMTLGSNLRGCIVHGTESNVNRTRTLKNMKRGSSCYHGNENEENIVVNMDTTSTCPDPKEMDQESSARRKVGNSNIPRRMMNSLASLSLSNIQSSTMHGSGSAKKARVETAVNCDEKSLTSKHCQNNSGEITQPDVLDQNCKQCNDIEDKYYTGQGDNIECIDYKKVLVYVVHKGSLIGDGTECRFTAECLILNQNTERKVILEFTGSTCRWYHLLYVRTSYILTVRDRSEDVLSLSLCNDKLHKILMKNSTMKCFSVHRDVCIEQIWDNMINTSFTKFDTPVKPIAEILDTCTNDKFVSFEGYIVARHLVESGFERRKHVDETGSFGMFSKLHVQDLDRRNDIWVYLNDDCVISSRGLIPGAIIKFYSLERKVSRLNNVYCRLMALSSVEYLSIVDERTKDIITPHNDDRIQTIYFSDLWTTRSSKGQIFQCICDVEKISKVSLKCICLICGSEFKDGHCSNKACKSTGGYRFVARARVIFDDGTSVAMVTITGTNVQTLLLLSEEQWKCLEDECMIHGELLVQQFNKWMVTDLDRFLYTLCDNQLVKKTWLLTFKSKYIVDINNTSIEEFSLKYFDSGMSRISTRCLPFLQLEGLQLSTYDPTQWILHHLITPD
ncbi:CST complex subunit ctc1 [Mactra antiquata]